MDQLISVKREHFRNVIRKKEIKAQLNLKRTLLEDQVYDHIPKLEQIPYAESIQKLTSILDELFLISVSPQHVNGFVNYQYIILDGFLQTKNYQAQFGYLQLMLNILAVSDKAHKVYEDYQDEIFDKFCSLIHQDQNQQLVDLILNILSNLMIDNNQPFIDYLLLEKQDYIIYRIIKAIENMNEVKLKAAIRFLFNLIKVYEMNDFIEIDPLLELLVTICQGLNKLDELEDKELYMLLKSFKNIMRISIKDGHHQPYGFKKYQEIMPLYFMCVVYMSSKTESKFFSLYRGYIAKALGFMVEHRLFRILILDKIIIETLAVMLIKMLIEDNNLQHKRSATIICSIIRLKMKEYQLDNLFIKQYKINNYDINILTLLQRQVADEAEQDTAVSSLTALLTLHDYGIQPTDFNEFYGLCPHVLKNPHTTNDVKLKVLELLQKSILSEESFKQIYFVYDSLGIRDLCVTFINSKNTEISSTALTFISIYDSLKEQEKKID